MKHFDLTIGSLAAQSGCKVQTIRYYEQIGLLPKLPRSAGNHRLFSREHLERLTFSRHSREFGFPLEAIRELLALSDDAERDCKIIDQIARARLCEVESRLARLTALKSELERMIAACRGGRIAECRIIETLGLKPG